MKVLKCFFFFWFYKQVDLVSHKNPKSVWFYKQMSLILQSTQVNLVSPASNFDFTRNQSEFDCWCFPQEKLKWEEGISGRIPQMPPMQCFENFQMIWILFFFLIFNGGKFIKWIPQFSQPEGKWEDNYTFVIFSQLERERF